MKRDVFLFVEDILQSINDIESFSLGLTEEEINENRLKQNAIIRSLEIIGEAVKNIPESFKKNYQEIPWRNIAGFRDVLTHGYFRIDIGLIWKIVKNDIPNLKEQILKIKKDLEINR